MGEKLKLGSYLKSDNPLEIELVKNIPESENMSFLIIARQGTGKTNLLMLIINQFYFEWIIAF